MPYTGPVTTLGHVTKRAGKTMFALLHAGKGLQENAAMVFASLAVQLGGVSIMMYMFAAFMSKFLTRSCGLFPVC